MDLRKRSQEISMDTRKIIHRTQAADCFLFVAPVTDFSRASSAAIHRERIQSLVVVLQLKKMGRRYIIYGSSDCSYSQPVERA